MPTLNADIAVQGLEQLLYSISSLLYLPVLLAVAGLALWQLVALGALCAEWRERRRGVRALPASAEAEMLSSLAAHEEQPGLEARLERIVQQSEARGLRQLDRVRCAIRIAPALGLMGTLIPMGIALAGLAQGDLARMAHNMVTAFTATVVGLACSVLAYLLSLVREHWLRSDMTDIAYAAETLYARAAATETREA